MSTPENEQDLGVFKSFLKGKLTKDNWNQYVIDLNRPLDLTGFNMKDFTIEEQLNVLDMDMEGVLLGTVANRAILDNADLTYFDLDDVVVAAQSLKNTQISLKDRQYDQYIRALKRVANSRDDDGLSLKEKFKRYTKKELAGGTSSSMSVEEARGFFAEQYYDQNIPDHLRTGVTTEQLVDVFEQSGLVRSTNDRVLYHDGKMVTGIRFGYNDRLIVLDSEERDYSQTFKLNASGKTIAIKDVLQEPCPNGERSWRDILSFNDREVKRASAWTPPKPGEGGGRG